MKHLKIYENFVGENKPDDIFIFKIGDIVGLTNPDYLESANAIMNNVNMNDAFKIEDIVTWRSYTYPFQLNLLRNGKFITYVGQSDIRKLEDHEIAAIKYNL